MSGDKTENKSGRQDFGLLNSNCALKISRQPAIPNLSGDTIQLSASGGTNYSWTGPTGFISMNKTHLF
jgi:hypothetical protein